MKKFFTVFACFVLSLILISCAQMESKKEIELMGAGDRIHDSFTFANTGVKIEEVLDKVYKISGSVEKLEDEKVKKEFDIADDVSHVVAIKLSANGRAVDKEKVEIDVNGVRNYDAEHLNGSDYTFIILEAIKSGSVSLSVKWDGEEEINYVIVFDDNLLLK